MQISELPVSLFRLLTFGFSLSLILISFGERGGLAPVSETILPSLHAYSYQFSSILTSFSHGDSSLLDFLYSGLPFIPTTI